MSLIELMRKRGPKYDPRGTPENTKILTICIMFSQFNSCDNNYFKDYKYSQSILICIPKKTYFNKVCKIKKQLKLKQLPFLRSSSVSSLEIFP